MGEEELDPRAELALLTSALRAHAEWQGALGASGLPAASKEEALARAPTPDAGADAPPRSEPPPAPPVRTAPPERTARAPRGAEPPPPAVESSPEPAPARRPPPPVEQLDPAERVRRLEVIRVEVAACTGCRLHSTRTQTVFARGDGSSGLAFVGEGPGADEDAQGEPFVGKAGQLLDRMIAAMGLTRDEVYVANIVKCRPPDNRKPQPDEMQSCIGYLERQLDIIQPQVIVALGATAVQGLLGTTEGITRLRGRFKLYRGRIAVMPTFHPAYLLRSPGAKRDVWTDLQAVLRQMGRPIPSTKSQ